MCAMLEANIGIERASKRLQEGAVKQEETLPDMPVVLFLQNSNQWLGMGYVDYTLLHFNIFLN